jgi:sugar lactone lactonase YvrE
MDIASCERARQGRVRSALVAGLALVAMTGCAGQPEAPTARGDIPIDGKAVHPESITSAADGSLFIGSMNGTIYRAGPKDAVAKPFILPSAENGLRAVFGVLADDKGGRLWVCSVANPFARAAGPAQPSEVVAFDLKSGQLTGRWAFPAPGGTCNDIAIAADGAAYATDTPGGRILKLPRGGNSLEVVANHQSLRGIDGIAFAADGRMYINNVQRHELWRVGLTADAAAPQLTLLNASRKMEGPDGLRPVGGNRFVQAEGTGGRITLVTIAGDAANIEVIRDGLQSTPGATLVGDTVYTIEGKINYLVDPQLRGQDPGQFRAIAIPMPR